MAKTETSFTRMDESTAEQWAVIGAETFKNQDRVAERVLGMLRSLDEITDGFATDQLTHCLQTATLAERAGADDEVVVAALCHDVGKAISVPNHPRIAAEILKPYVRDEVYKMIL
ncbi:MAG TPA: HD domain-containing protein, partial [Acidimicrobiales bacterium]|nr:HD domain-containing protein [Acidimicrobiales bacterium]